MNARAKCLALYPKLEKTISRRLLKPPQNTTKRRRIKLAFYLLSVTRGRSCNEQYHSPAC